MHTWVLSPHTYGYCEIGLFIYRSIPIESYTGQYLAINPNNHRYRRIQSNISPYKHIQSNTSEQKSIQWNKSAYIPILFDIWQYSDICKNTNQYL